MIRRLVFFSALILAAAVLLCGLGYYSITVLQQGLEGRRVAEFAAVAQQIRSDVRQKLDEFIIQEQNRPYTDYQYYYVPQTLNQQEAALVRSPLGDSLEHGLAYGHFQVEPDGGITTPFYSEGQKEPFEGAGPSYIASLKSRLLPALGGKKLELSNLYRARRLDTQVDVQRGSKVLGRQAGAASSTRSKAGQAMSIETLGEMQRAQVELRDSRNVELNLSNSALAKNAISAGEMQQYKSSAPEPSAQRKLDGTAGKLEKESDAEQVEEKNVELPQADRQAGAATDTAMGAAPSFDKAEKVEIKIEPFVPMLVETEKLEPLGSEVYLVRHVQIAGRHLVQGFKLDQEKLKVIVGESAQRMIREGMSYAMDIENRPDAAYAAVLDFGFGEILINLIETEPGRIAGQVRVLRYWYFGIVAAVLAMSGAGIASLWKNVRAQLKLAQKKDDFISAVSHELRTPLASIRMYSEMLEKNWVKSEDKKSEYYSSMRQESERLSRLIENVLDFARIQKGRKNYNFKAGNVNTCILKTVEMMRPCAEEAGFKIEQELAEVPDTVFDADAVTQIAVNLIDNAIKYTRQSTEKVIKVRTRVERGFLIIEVEDRGPGVTKGEQARIFEEFYRIESESTRSTTGTGLGLALVKKFAQAHNGFVEVANARPGAVFRVYLPA